MSDENIERQKLCQMELATDRENCFPEKVAGKRSLHRALIVREKFERDRVENRTIGLLW